MEPVTFNARLARADLMHYYFFQRTLYRPLLYVFALGFAVYCGASVIAINPDYPDQQLVISEAVIFGCMKGLRLFGIMLAIITLVHLLRVVRQKPDGILLAQNVVTLDSSGIEAKSANSQAKFAWNQFSRISQDRRLVIIWLKESYSLGVVLPRRDCPEGSFKLIQTYLKQTATS